MKAIILTAGYGRRMQPLSESCHKALLSVGGITILGRIVDGLLGIGVRDIVVVTGYRADDIRGFLATRYPGVLVSYVHNAHFDSSNNIVSLSLALDRAQFDADVLLIECDLLFDPAVLRQLTGANRGNAALVDRYRPGMDGTVVAVEDGVITHVYPPHLQGRDFLYGDKFKTLNIYRFEREFCRTTLQPLLHCYANLIDGNCYYELVLGMLVNMQRQRIEAAVVDSQHWTEVDDPNDLAVARFNFEPERRPEMLDHAMGGLWNFDVLDFAFMANAYFPTDAMVAAIRQALPDLLRNYGSCQAVLNQKLAYVLRCRSDRLQALHGASQAFPLLPDILGGRPTLVPSPTFGEYSRAFPAAVPYADRPGYDLDEVERQLPSDGVLVVVNPNSPTGTTVATGSLYALAARRPDACIVVDESFVDFSSEPSIIEALERRPLPNVIVLKSLSKSLGVPGLRVGFLYCSDPVIVKRVGAALPIWNLSAPAEYLVELLLKFRSELAVSIERTIDDRETAAAQLSALPLVDCVYASGGNFLLVRLAGGDHALGASVRKALLVDHRIHVKHVSHKFSDGAAYLRVAIRRPDDNARLVAALAAVAATRSVTA